MAVELYLAINEVCDCAIIILKIDGVEIKRVYFPSYRDLQKSDSLDPELTNFFKPEQEDYEESEYSNEIEESEESEEPEESEHLSELLSGAVNLNEIKNPLDKWSKISDEFDAQFGKNDWTAKDDCLNYKSIHYSNGVFIHMEPREFMVRTQTDQDLADAQRIIINDGYEISSVRHGGGAEYSTFVWI